MFDIEKHLIVLAFSHAGSKPHTEKLAQVHRLLKEGVTSLNADDKCAPAVSLTLLYLCHATVLHFAVVKASAAPAGRVLS